MEEYSENKHYTGNGDFSRGGWKWAINKAQTELHTQTNHLQTKITPQPIPQTRFFSANKTHIVQIKKTQANQYAYDASISLQPGPELF